jgi:long-chain acyl-CoA synthetase
MAKSGASRGECQPDNFESLKRFRVVNDEWPRETGELTPFIKLKRRVIKSRYAALIDEFYADEATARGE